jgi:hypothetical protein
VRFKLAIMIRVLLNKRLFILNDRWI